MRTGRNSKATLLKVLGLHEEASRRTLIDGEAIGRVAANDPLDDLALIVGALYADARAPHRHALVRLSALVPRSLDMSSDEGCVVWALPKRENVEFFDTEKAATAAGYRMSQRASGDQTALATQRAAMVAKACQLIERSETLPNLDEMASEVGMSPFHFHRVFKAEVGLTPKAYAAGLRGRKLREELGDHANSVTAAIYGAGFNSNSRFYAASSELLGMRARDYRAGGLNMEVRFAVGQSALGAILVAQSQFGICAILLGDDPDQLVRDLQDQFPKARLIGGDEAFEQLVAQVVGFVEAPSLGLNLPLDVQGTAFQERVWQALREIPPGATVSYAQVAARIGQPKAVRAVAQACGANHIAVAIPCHRVVRNTGELSGYRWGVERKRELLRREAS